MQKLFTSAAPAAAKLIVLITLASASICLAQQPAESAPAKHVGQNATTNIVERTLAPTATDVNCAGFLTHQPVASSLTISGGYNSPDATRFGGRDNIFVAGSGANDGDKFRVVRPFSSFQGKLDKKAGIPYVDLGIVHITHAQGDKAVAYVDFSCEEFMIGDLLVPFTERPALTFTRKPTSMDPFAIPPAATTGKIVFTKDYDSFVGTGRKVYLNLGETNGLKPGDYLRVTRGYDLNKDMGPLERASANATLDENFKANESNRKMKKRFANMPRKTVGELMILSVRADTATAMVTSALEPINIGDDVQVDAAK